MGWLGVAISIGAVWLLWDNGPVWIAVSIGVAILEFVTWGIMHNFAVEAAKNRPGYTGGFSDFTAREVDAVPNWLAQLNLAGFVAAVGLLIAGFII